MALPFVFRAGSRRHPLPTADLDLLKLFNAGSDQASAEGSAAGVAAAPSSVAEETAVIGQPVEAQAASFSQGPAVDPVQQLQMQALLQQQAAAAMMPPSAFQGGASNATLYQQALMQQMMQAQAQGYSQPSSADTPAGTSAQGGIKRQKVRRRRCRRRTGSTVPRQNQLGPLLELRPCVLHLDAVAPACDVLHPRLFPHPQTQAEIEEQIERTKKRRRESAQRSRQRKNCYMRSLEIENEALKREVERLR